LFTLQTDKGLPWLYHGDFPIVKMYDEFLMHQLT